MPDVVDQPTERATSRTIRPVLPYERMQIHFEHPPSDAEFAALCKENENIRIEQNPNGSLVIMSPTGGLSGARNTRITRYLDQWAEEDGTGIAFDSSTMFRLPNDAHRMPDAAWVQRERYLALTEEERAGFVPLAPDFVIELRSPTDPLDVLKTKMNEYMRTGVRLSWLIDPETKTVTMYAANQPPETLDAPSQVAADSVVTGFALPMKRIWDPLDAA